MSNYARVISADLNDMSRSLGALVGIAQGLICDGQLNDQEIRFLESWLDQNSSISSIWPGDVIHARVRHVLSDGVVNDDERHYLIDTLRELIGGPAESLAGSQHVTELGFDEVERVDFPEQQFCLTGNFVYGPRALCEEVTSKRGGVISSVTKRLRYLVVGSRGSNEWKHGSFGTKFEKAIQYKRVGCPILIVHEACWTGSL